MKRIISLFIIFILSFNLTFRVFAISIYTSSSANKTSDTFSYESVAEKRGALSVTGSIPVLKSYNNSIFESNINKTIKTAYEAKLKEVEKSKYNKSVHFVSDINTNDNIVSIILRVTITSSTTKSEVITLNYNNYTDKILTINDILGENGENIINKYIKKEIKQNPDKYNSNFNGISKNQSFYLTKKILVVIFDQGKISPASENTVTFEIDPKKIKNYKINKEDYIIKNDFDIKMIPIRTVCEEFGYLVNWDGRTKSIIISKESFSTSISLNKNNYKTAAKTFKILESEPYLENGVTYVPISFFDEILGLNYSINNSNITFSLYQ